MDRLEKQRENEGSPVLVRIEEPQWNSMDELIKMREHEIDKEDGLVDAEVVMRELKIGKKRLANLLSKGRITPDMYTVSPVNGIKKFRLNKILGIEKSEQNK